MVVVSCYEWITYKNEIACDYSLGLSYLLSFCPNLLNDYATFLNDEVMGNLKLLLEAAMAAVVPVKVAVEEVLLQYRKSQLMVEEVQVQVLVLHRNSQLMML